MTTPTDAARREFLGVGFDHPDSREMAGRIDQIQSNSPMTVLVTPNVDHLVRIGRGGSEADVLSSIFRSADICVCDSRVLAGLASVCGVTLPVYPGSDLVRMIFAEHLRAGDRICLVGGDDMLKQAIAGLRPDIEIAQHRPPMGLRSNPAAIREAAAFVVGTDARFHFLAVGSPQQEMIAAEAKAIGGGRGLVLCIGAGIEFLTGKAQRAPKWMQRMSLEWLFRLLSEPRRLWRRYLLDGPRIFAMAWHWRRAQKMAGGNP